MAIRLTVQPSDWASSNPASPPHTKMHLTHPDWVYERYTGEASARYQRAIDQRRELGDRYYEATTLQRLGDTYLASGPPAAATRAWSAARTILETLDHAGTDSVRQKLTTVLPIA